MNKIEFWLMNNPIRRVVQTLEAKKLRNMSPSRSPDKVLEIGCGEGQGAKNILKYWNPKSLISIDLDPKMIARAKRRVSDSRVDFAIGDASDLSFAQNNMYDAIFDFGIIHHIPDWKNCLKELHRVLKPGGYLHIEDLSIESFTKNSLGRTLKRVLDHPYEQMFTRKEFEKELERLGFVVVDHAKLAGLRVFWRVLQKPE